MPWHFSRLFFVEWGMGNGEWGFSAFCDICGTRQVTGNGQRGTALSCALRGIVL